MCVLYDGVPPEEGLERPQRASFPLASRRRSMLRASLSILFAVLASATIVGGQERKTHPYKADLNMDPPHITKDKSVTYDYDIVYVRAPRREKGNSLWAEVG